MWGAGDFPPRVGEDFEVLFAPVEVLVAQDGLPVMKRFFFGKLKNLLTPSVGDRYY